MTKKKDYMLTLEELKEFVQKEQDKNWEEEKKFEKENPDLIEEE